jgi:peptidoglycan/xylan/chitin deacetylase (PgdA/CDA1 family)
LLKSRHTLLSLLVALSVSPACAQGPPRAVAVTFDDLPVARYGGLVEAQSVTRRLVAQVEALDIPAIGFVNESKVDVEGEEAERTALLQMWLDAGLSLGNHTYSHPSLWSTPLPEFERDVERGERVTARLLEERGQSLRYFRHPYLNTGPDLETKEAFERYLVRRGYTVAPVTLDNDDFAYALAYDNALAASDSSLVQRIVADYLRYMNETAAFYERLSERALGREPAQVLLLHANALNADHLDSLVEMFRDRGYEFVTLERALEDPAYNRPDEYVGRSGLSWIQRWAITRDGDPGTQPPSPEWVREIAWPD